MRHVIFASVLAMAAFAAGCSQPKQPQPAAESPLESAMQGQVSLADQESGRSQRPYMWNMRLVGQQDIQNRGQNGNLAWLDDCAYVAAYFGGTDPLTGMAVVDASNPKNPELVKLFPGTPGTRESQVEANDARRIVIVMPFRHPKTPYGDPPGPTQLQIYQASADCKAVTRVGTYDFGEIITHEHRIASDGNTVYASVGGGGGAATNPEGKELPPSLIAVDISDLTRPKEIARWDLSHEPGMPDSGMHDLDLNDEGTRGYTMGGYTTASDGIRHKGLTIVDLSEVQQRKPNPQIRRISTFNWGPPDSPTSNPHSVELVKIRGRSYAIGMDESGNPSKAPWGWTRILDVTEEKYPLQISTIKLDVSEEKSGNETNKDRAYYSSHYLGVDNREEASLVFLTWYVSGLRTWDIRDPYDPKEIGYYIPGARPNSKMPASDLYYNKNVDYVYSFVRYRPETGHIWFNSLYNGFMIAELENNPLRPNSQSH